MPIRNWISSSASIHITSVSSRREIESRKLRKINVIKVLVPFSARDVVVVVAIIFVPPISKFWVWQRRSEGRVAMTTRPHGRLRKDIQDARWRPLVVDDAQRTLLPRDSHQMLERCSPGKLIKPPFDSSLVI